MDNTAVPAVPAAAVEPLPAAVHAAVTVLPPFLPDDPTMWFDLIEARFACAYPHPNNGTKFFLLLNTLPPDIATNCRDVMRNCTEHATARTGNPYEAMKNAVLQFTTKPKWSCYMDLHNLPPQGDIKPSLLMAKLTNCLPPGANKDCDLFYSFFMFRMPQYLREILAASEFTCSRDMAAAANRIWDLRQSAPTVAAAALSQPRDRSSSPHRGREDRRNNGRRQQGNRRGRSQTPHHQAKFINPDNGICYFHNKFRNQAFTCGKDNYGNPCQWNGPDARSGNGASSR
jgi:hypothetical protein